MVAVVTVMSVQPTSEKRTVPHDSGSAAWAATDAQRDITSSKDLRPFMSELLCRARVPAHPLAGAVD
ncbi:hypothetical protein D3C81_1688160 [compost metagenome]